MRTALTIAGSDSGGGAGIQADLKTFAAHGVFGTSAITAVTAQNTLGVAAVEALPPAIVVAQIDAVRRDLGADATKIGMLANAAIVRGGRRRASGAIGSRHVVLDTVMVAKSGARLLDDDAVGGHARAPAAARRPCHAERARGRSADRPRSSRRSTICGARPSRLVELGARAALVKGGHLDGPAVDVLWSTARR